MGALAFGIGSSEVTHVLATQTLWQRKPNSMRITVEGDLAEGVTGKDVILAIIATITAAGATGHVIEYAGSAIRGLSMEGRLTLCNMSIEAGGRAGMVAPDETTYAYLKGRPYAPAGQAWEQAVQRWRRLPTDPGAVFDTEVTLDAATIEPMVTWGTSPQDAIPISAAITRPGQNEPDPDRRAWHGKGAGLTWACSPGTQMTDVPVDRVFIGSCTNGRIEDLRAAAAMARGRHVAPGVVAWVVPGSGLIKRQAEAEGLDRILVRDAGFEWRQAGCSMCLGTNGDIVAPGQRCASTSNRNFQGRQGSGRAHPSHEPGAWPPRPRSPAGWPISVLWRVQHEQPVHRYRRGRLAPCRARMSIPTRSSPPVTSAARGSWGWPNACSATCASTPTARKSPDFVLNQAPYREARVVVGEHNFGCGSSRENAVWAFHDYGFRVAIAPSFGDIFRNNCFQNGMLPVILPRQTVDSLMAQLQAASGRACAGRFALADRDVSGRLEARASSIDPFRKHCLLNGVDEISFTLGQSAQIAAFEHRYGRENME